MSTTAVSSLSTTSEDVDSMLRSIEEHHSANLATIDEFINDCIADEGDEHRVKVTADTYRDRVKLLMDSTNLDEKWLLRLIKLRIRILGSYHSKHFNTIDIIVLKWIYG